MGRLISIGLVGLVVWVAGCSANEVGMVRQALTDGSVGDAGLDPGTQCTRTPDGWLAWCAENTSSALASECSALLTTDDPELAALSLNLRASELGLFPTGLDTLRFAHVARSFATVGEWFDHLVSMETAERTRFSEFASQANRAFLNCEDSEVLLPSRTRPVCYPDATVSELVGAEGFVCSAFDSECAVGELRGSCCHASYRPNGMPCDAGAGQCVAGACRPNAEIPDLSAPQLNHSTVGSEHHIDVASGGRASLSFPDYPAGRTVRIALDGEPMVDLDPGDETLVLAQVRVGRTADGIHSVLTPAIVTTTLILPEADEVCILNDDPSDPSPSPLDCSTRGLRVLCPSSDGDVECVTEDGRSRVTAPNLFAAWPMSASSSAPQRQAMNSTWLCTSHLPALGALCVNDLPWRPGCFPPGSKGSCVMPCNKPGFRECAVFGSWSTCVPFSGLPLYNDITRGVDECDGLDNDCDGDVDEHSTCDDGLTCTDDVCLLGTCVGARNDTCATPFTESDASCSVWRCAQNPLPDGPVPGSGFPGVDVTHVGDPRCEVFLRHGECTDRDGCDCNGHERCSPISDGVGTDGDGCYAADPPPCNEDGDLCTLEPCCADADQAANCLNTMDPEQLEAYRRGCRIGEALGRTYEAPWSPSDSSRQVTCVSDVSVERTCEDLNDCTVDSCTSATGSCNNNAKIEGTSCAIGLESPHTCRARRCDADARCLHSPDPPDQRECGAVEVDGPPEDALLYELERDPYNAPEDEITYTATCPGVWFPREVALASCHTGACTLFDGRCVVNSGYLGCPEAGPTLGCLESFCTDRTDVSYPGLPCDEACPAPCDNPDADTRAPVIGCDLRPNFRNCIPPGNECLRDFECASDGTCSSIPDHAFCRNNHPELRRNCDPGGPPSEPREPTCEPTTGRCMADPCIG